MGFRLPAALLCFAVAAFAATRASASAPTHARSSGVGEALGGLGAFAAQASWLRADMALQANREDDALLHMQAVAALEPQLVSVSRMMAFEIGASLAEGRADPAVRWSLIRAGLRILDRAVELNPGSADAHAFRASYLTVRVAAEPHADAQYRRVVDREGPVAGARRDHRAAARLRPEDPLHHVEHAVAAGAHALELAEAGRWDDAAAAADEAAAAQEAVLALMAAENADRPGTRGGETADGIRASRDSARELAAIARLPSAERKARFDAFLSSLGD